MFPRPMSEEHELHGSMYPDPPQGAFTTAALDMGLAPDPYFPRMAQEFPTALGSFFTMDGPSGWPYSGTTSPPTFPDDREMGVASNMSPGSVPSAPSSAVGSPRSTHDQPAPVPEWAPQGVMSPGIVGHQDYFAGTEYSFAAPGMEDLTPFAYADSSKPPGFVGESPQASTSAAPQPSQQQQHHCGPVSPSVSRRESSCTALSETEPAVYTPSKTAYAQIGQTPISPLSSRKSSIYTSPDISTPLSSPTAAGWTSPTIPHVPPFFSQSSGHFIAPLGSSCWFPLTYSSFQPIDTEC